MKSGSLFSLLVHALAVCGLLLGLSAAALADDFNVVPTYGVPEGINPVQYLAKVQVNEAGSGSPPQREYDPEVIYYWPTANGDISYRAYASSGYIPWNPTDGQYETPIDLNNGGDAFRAMSPSKAVRVQDDFTGGVYNSTSSAPYLLGFARVYVKDGSGAMVTGATIHMLAPSLNGSEITVATHSDGSPVIMGHPAYITADSPFCPGVSSRSMTFYATKPGWGNSGYFGITGSACPGSDITLVMSSDGSVASSSSSASPSGLDVAPSTGTTGTTGSGTGGSDLSGVAGFIANFWQTLETEVTKFFTPDPADLTALKAAATQFTTWGPLKIPSVIQAAWSGGLSGTSGSGTTDSDPQYWWFPLLGGFGTNGVTPSTPTGYTGHTSVLTPNARNSMRAWAHFLPGSSHLAPADDAAPGERPHMMLLNPHSAGLRPLAVTGPGTTMDPNLWASLIPTHWDLTPYAPGIIFMRGLEWAAGWFFFVRALWIKFTPQVRI